MFYEKSILECLNLDVMKVNTKRSMIYVYNDYEIFDRIFRNFVNFNYSFEVPKEELKGSKLFDEVNIIECEDRNYDKITCLVPSLLYDGVNVYRLVVYVEKMFLSNKKVLDVLAKRVILTVKNIYTIKNLFEDFKKEINENYYRERKEIEKFLLEDNVNNVIENIPDNILEIYGKMNDVIITDKPYEVSVNTFNLLLYLILRDENLLYFDTTLSKGLDGDLLMLDVMKKLRILKRKYYEIPIYRENNELTTIEQL